MGRTTSQLRNEGVDVINVNNDSLPPQKTPVYVEERSLTLSP